MDQKTLDSLCTQLSLLQIQINALMVLFQAQQPTEPVRQQFQRLVDGGVQRAGLETMQGFRDRIRQGVVQQNLKHIGFDDLWKLDPDSPEPSH